jgi:hypothetical protein
MFAALETYAATNQLQPKQRPEDARQDAGAFAANLTLVKGTVLGKRTSTGELEAYNDAHTTGVNVAVGILMYTIKTNATGQVFFSDSTDASLNNTPHQTAPYWQSGIFDTGDLTGYDANALADMQGHVLANGFISIP